MLHWAIAVGLGMAGALISDSNALDYCANPDYLRK